MFQQKSIQIWVDFLLCVEPLPKCIMMIIAFLIRNVVILKHQVVWS